MSKKIEKSEKFYESIFKEDLNIPNSFFELLNEVDGLDIYGILIMSKIYNCNDCDLTNKEFAAWLKTSETTIKRQMRILKNNNLIKSLTSCKKGYLGTKRYLNLTNKKDKEEDIRKIIPALKLLPNSSNPFDNGYVYFFKKRNFYKIGFSKNPQKRMYSFSSVKYPIEVLSVSKKINNAYIIEQFLHKKLQKYSVKNEWYNFTDLEVSAVCDLINSIGNDI